MKFIRLCVRRPVGTFMFFVGVLLLGYVSLRNLKVDLLPSLSYPKLTVVTEYPGAAPQEVEKLITEPLEADLSSIPSLKKLYSTSREGLSIITLEFHWGTDMDFALLHTKEKVEEGASHLPTDCEKPSIYQWDPSSKPIIIAVLEGKAISQLRDTATYLIKPRLERLDGIAKVEVRGGGKEEVLVSLDPEKMALYGVSFDEVANAIDSYNQLVLGGTVRKEKLRFVLKVEGEIKEPGEIEKIPIKSISRRDPDGENRVEREILIGDIGKAGFSRKIKQGDIRYNGAEAVALMIYKESSANTVAATERVEKEMKNIEKEFSGLNFRVISKEASLIKSSIYSIKISIYIGALLAFFVLLLFLQNLRDPILVALVIPISVISTFVLMYFAKVNLNIMSLGGLALGVGMFVDNSIVVLESMFRHRKEKPADEAAVDGATEVAGAITAATLTTIVIFLPVIYIYGITGKLFRDLALTVSFSLLSSLFVALTLLPSMFAAFAGKKEKKEKAVERPEKNRGALPLIHRILAFPFLLIGYGIKYLILGFVFLFKNITYALSSISKAIFAPIFEGFSSLYSWFDEKYHNFLKLCFRKKSIPYSISVLMIVFAVLFYFALKKELLPSPKTDKYELQATTPSYLGFEETDRIAREIEGKLLSRKTTAFVFSQVGAVSKLGSMEEALSVNSMEGIIKSSKREKDMEYTRRTLPRFPGLVFSVFPERNTLSRYLRLGAESFQIKVFYERQKDGIMVVNNIMRKINGIKGLADLRTNAVEGKPVLALKFKEEVLRETGITRKELSELIEAIFRGRKVSTMRRFQRTYDVVLSTPLREKRSLDAMMRLPVEVKGRKYRLSELVGTEKLSSVKEITREGQESYFLIAADLKGRSSDISRRVRAALARMEIPPGVRIKIAGEEEERQKAFGSIKEALILAVLLVFMVMAAQFENLIHPLIIMLTLPMGLFGGFFLLLITDSTLNVISGIGLLVMTGIVVNDAIVKVDYANKLRKKGMGAREAMLEASRVRLRPILMTTFTTVFGLLPMSLMQMQGSELQRPLAIVIIGGLLASTFLTLILIPVLYEAVER